MYTRTHNTSSMFVFTHAYATFFFFGRYCNYMKKYCFEITQLHLKFIIKDAIPALGHACLIREAVALHCQTQTNANWSKTFQFFFLNLESLISGPRPIFFLAVIG